MNEIPQSNERVVAADRALAGLMGTRGPDHCSDYRDRVRAFKHRCDDRRRGDHADEVVVEELPLVHGVVLLGHRAVHLQKAQRGEAQPALLETREELEGDASLERIGFEDDERALGTHDAITTETSSATGGEIAASDARGPIAARYASSGRRYSRATR